MPDHYSHVVSGVTSTVLAVDVDGKASIKTYLSTLSWLRDVPVFRIETKLARPAKNAIKL